MDPNDPSAVQPIVPWFISKGLIKSYDDQNNIKANVTYLIGMKTFIDGTSSSKYQNTTGITFQLYWTNDAGIRDAGTSYCVIWTDKLLNVSYFSNGGLAIANNVAHELGHAAGRLLPNTITTY